MVKEPIFLKKSLVVKVPSLKVNHYKLQEINFFQIFTAQKGRFYTEPVSSSKMSKPIRNDALKKMDAFKILSLKSVFLFYYILKIKIVFTFGIVLLKIVFLKAAADFGWFICVVSCKFTSIIRL